MTAPTVRTVQSLQSTKDATDRALQHAELIDGLLDDLGLSIKGLYRTGWRWGYACGAITGIVLGVVIGAAA